MAAVLAGSARAPLTALLLLFELTHDIRIVLPLMAAAGLSAALVERWQGLADPGLLGPDLLEEKRRRQLTGLSVRDAYEQEAPLVLPAALPAQEALGQLVESHGHCLVVADGPWVLGLVTLPDLQRALSAYQAAGLDQKPTGQEPTAIPTLQACRRGDLVWLPETAHLAQLEDQLSPNGLRQVPIFAVPAGVAGALPHGLPSGGLPLSALRGLASRDGLSRALAKHLTQAGPSLKLVGEEPRDEDQPKVLES